MRSRRRWWWYHPVAGAARQSRRISPPRSAPRSRRWTTCPAVKVAFQAERRFWELDEAIYGGISWTTRDITQIWYPSAGIHQRKGILVGAYIWSDDLGDEFAAMPPAQRLDAHWPTANGCIPG